jgi:citrate lyase beta subunit
MTAPDLAAARCALFVPGNREERFAKAIAAGADAVILDLEDAVVAGDKARARDAVLAFFAAGGSVPRARPDQAVGLRVNNVHTRDGLADLAALVASGATPDFVLVPKVESAVEARLFGRHLDRAGADIGLACLIESVRGIDAAAEIAAAHARVRTLVFGAADYSLDQRVRPSWEPLLAARSRLAQVAGAAHLGLIDAPHFELENLAGLAEEAGRSLALGFTGKLAVHPRQVPVIQEAYAPTEAEVARAQRIIAALEAAGGNVCELDGEMVEGPVVAAARQVLARARR